jgi:hypothetical protein
MGEAMTVGTMKWVWSCCARILPHHVRDSLSKMTFGESRTTAGRGMVGGGGTMRGEGGWMQSTWDDGGWLGGGHVCGLRSMQWADVAVYHSSIIGNHIINVIVCIR